MEAPCFLRSGSAGDMTLAILGPRIGLLISKSGDMAVLPRLVRQRCQGTGTGPQPRLL